MREYIYRERDRDIQRQRQKGEGRTKTLNRVDNKYTIMFYNLVIMYINLLNFRQHLLNLFSTVKYFVTLNYFSNFFVNILVFHPLQDFLFL